MSSSFQRRRRRQIDISTNHAGNRTGNQAINQTVSSSGSRTSFGLREIDALLFRNVGQTVPSFVLLEEDRLTQDLVHSVARCWCAEGVAQAQRVLLAACVPQWELAAETNGCLEGSSVQELREFRINLPRNLHWDKWRHNQPQQKETKLTTHNNYASSNRDIIGAIPEEHDNDVDGGHEDTSDNQHHHHHPNNEGLINAWQYRKSVQLARSGIPNEISQTVVHNSGSTHESVFCHSFDLSQRMWDQFDPLDNSNNNSNNNSNSSLDLDNYVKIPTNPLLSLVKIIDCSTLHLRDCCNPVQGMTLFQKLWKHIQTITTHHPHSMIRLYIPRLPVGPGSAAMTLLMTKIRKEKVPVVILATIRPWRWISSPNFINTTTSPLDTLTSLRHTADTTLSLDAFSSLRTPPPPEFAHLHGILTVRKCSPVSSTALEGGAWKNRPLAERFGVTRDARKLTVQLLHLPPMEFNRRGDESANNLQEKDVLMAEKGGGTRRDSERMVGCSSSNASLLDF